MEGNALPLYDVEFLPVERRLTDRRKNVFDMRALNAAEHPALERRLRDRRQAPQALRAVQ